MNDIALSCQDLAKTFTEGARSIEVLRQVNLVVKRKECVAIIGSSGSGKSTLLHLLGGLDQPTRGTVLIQDKILSQLSEKEKCYLRNHALGFVYQFHHLLPEFTALENVGLPLLIRGVKIQEVREKSAHLLEQVGLQERMQHRLHQLSGGERQRVAIARALVGDPVCVLADEPTGNLDPRHAERVLQIFMDLQKTCGTSIVMVTHDQHTAQKADRLLMLLDGCLTSLR